MRHHFRRSTAFATRALAGAVMVLAAVAAGPAPLAAAQSPTEPAARATWGIQPASAEGAATRPALRYDLAPGETITDAVRITNHAAEELTLDVYATDAFNTPTGGFDVLAGGKAPTDVGSWVRLDRQTVVVAPRASVDVPFTLAVPSDAGPGDHTGGVVASRRSSATSADGDVVAVDHRVGTRLYLRVDGPLRQSLIVEDLDAGYEGTANPVGRGDVTVTYRVRNAGNVRVTAAQRLEVGGPFGIGGRTVTLDALPELLPGATFADTVVVERVLPLGRLVASIELAPEESELGGDVRAGTDSWAVPWTSLAALAVAGGGVAFLRRRRRVPGPIEAAVS